MIQGPQLVNQALSGVAERLLNPAVTADPERLTNAINSARLAEASNRLMRTERAATDDVATVFTRAGGPEAIARIETHGMRSELVRAETMLQIAQEAYTAIEVLYGGMAELARLALDESLTVEQRQALNGAYQELKQDVEDIINATVFDGEHLLKEGEGPNGEFVIHLSSVGDSGEPLDILIPPGSVMDKIEGLKDADLLSVESALMVMEGAGKAAEILSAYGNLTESQRAVLQRIYATGVAPGQSLADYVTTFETPKYAEGLSRLVADIVLAGGDVPFEESADRLRDVLARTIEDQQPPAAGAAVNPRPVQVNNIQVQNTRLAVSLDPDTGEAPLREAAGQLDGHQARRDSAAKVDADRPSDSFAAELVRAGEAFAKAEAVLNSMREKLVALYRLAEEVALDGGAPPPDREEKAAEFQALKARLDVPAPLDTRDADGKGEAVLAGGDGSGGGIVVRLPGRGEGGSGRDITIPSLLVKDLSPDLVEAKIPTAAAALEAMKHIDAAITDIVDVALTEVRQARASIATDRGLAPRPVTTQLAGDVHGAASMTPAAKTDPEADAIQLAAAPVTVAPQIEQVVSDRQRDRLRIEVLDAEVPKLREMDAARRATGLVQQVSNADTRIEAGLAIQRTVYEAPTDQASAFGAAIPVEPGGFMTELLRADHMLHVADLSIAQIDVNLDYMRGLAEEAAGDSSRYRIALNEIFQVVKLNIVDPLAQSAEAQGEKILAGGNGPDGEFVIHLSEGIVAGEAHDIAIPSMRIRDLSSDLFYADIRTRESALAAVDHIEFASENAANARDMIAEQRNLIRRLMAMNISRNT